MSGRHVPSALQVIPPLFCSVLAGLSLRQSGDLFWNAHSESLSDDGLKVLLVSTCLRTYSGREKEQNTMRVPRVAQRRFLIVPDAANKGFYRG